MESIFQITFIFHFQQLQTDNYSQFAADILPSNQPCWASKFGISMDPFTNDIPDY